MIELAMAGMLQCVIATQIIVDEDRKCFYHCIDSSKEFASTLKQYQDRICDWHKLYNYC